MAYSQTNSSLLIEIQNLKEELDSSKKTVEQYASLIAKLSVELDNLRSGICQACKKKLVPGISAPLINSGSPRISSSLFCCMFQGWKRQHRSRSPVNTTARNSSDRLMIPRPIVNTSILVPSGPAIAPEPTTIGGSDEQMTTSQPKSELPEWSVIHNPEVKKALDLHVAHVFTYKSRVSCVNMSRDGKRVAIGLNREGRTYINEVRTGSNICVLVDRYVTDPLHIGRVQFSPDGQLVATAASDWKIRVWDITQRRMRAIFGGDNINSIAFSSDNHYLVSASHDPSVRVWNTRDGSSKKLTDNAGWFLDVAFSPDGRYIGAANYDHSLVIWDARTAKLIARWQGHTGFVRCLKFTPDGEGLMSGSEDKTFKYWDASSLGIYQVQSGKGVVVPGQGLREIRRFEGHNDTVLSIGFFPRDTQWVLTSSDDRSVRIWDMETGIWQLCLQGQVAFLDVDVTRTGTFLATAGGGHVTLWKYKQLQV